MSCHSSGDSVKIKLPGLQVFSQNVWNRSNSTVGSNNAKISSGVESMQARKLSDWGIETLNDSSPTVVASADFECGDRPLWLEEDIDEELARLEDAHHPGDSQCEQLAAKVFLELPLGSHGFAEEFQYTIIASQLLMDTVRPLWSHPKLQKLTADFSAKQAASRACKVRTVPTKFGKLTTINKGFMLRRTVPFLPTFLLARRCLGLLLQAVKSGHTKSTRRIFIVITTAVYLAIQQEVFFSHYLRHATLTALRSTVDQFQSLDKLLHRLHMRYKELTIYKPISLVQSSQPTGCSDLPIIRDVLTASLDFMFYGMKRIITDILPILEHQDLFRYCEIYAINLVDIFFAINGEAIEVGEKATRTHLLKKFILCCLLSIGPRAINPNTEVHDFTERIQRIFPSFSGSASLTESERSLLALKHLKELVRLLQEVGCFLKQYKLHIIDPIQSPEQTLPSQNGRQYQFRTATTLNMMKELQKVLIVSPPNSEEELELFMAKKLDDLSNLWRKCGPYKSSKCQNLKKDRHTSGLQLDVVQSPTQDSQEFDFQQNLSRAPKLGLNAAIEVKTVDGSQSDFDLESEQEYDQTITEEVCFAHSQEEVEEDSSRKGYFLKLTDDELRDKLNERIMSLARENRKGKEELRTKKSFGLLGEDYKRKDNMRSRPSHRSGFTSEESIPVLYELKQLLKEQ